MQRPIAQLLLTITLLEPVSARSAAVAPRVSIAPTELSIALTTLARQVGIDILFSEALVAGRTSRRVSGQIPAETALTTLLAGSGLTFHRTDGGAYIINAVPDSGAVTVAVVEAAIPEILVVGHLAQNGDIRRAENDIQPYQVFSGGEIEDSHTGSVDAFARSRLPANAQLASPAQDLINGLGSPRSEINLRGLGANQTLVLVDGRRMPNIPQIAVSSLQPDVNGIPASLIDRIEVLTATAGGIYGIGATAGVLNIVLKHDYRGAQLDLTTGVTTRGDAPEVRLAGRIGFTPDHGRTSVMLAFSQTWSGRLRNDDRDYFQRARARALANDPVTFLATHPTGNAINIYSDNLLALNSANGGTSLAAKTTSLPLGTSGNVGERNALLLANAGQIDIRPGGAEAEDTILGRPDIRSIFVDARRDLGGGVEAFVNALQTHNVGHSITAGQTIGNFGVPNGNPLNPFQDTIYVSAPLPGLTKSQTSTVDVTRYTVGLLVPLPGNWKSDVEYSGGGVRAHYFSDAKTLDGTFGFALRGVEVEGKPAIEPLGNWRDYVAALSAYRRDDLLDTPRDNHFHDATLRLAGPIGKLPGGPLTLTLLAEERGEITSESLLSGNFGTDAYTTIYPRFSRRVRSLYGEARLPLVAEGGVLSRLDLQLAVRQDWTRDALPGTSALFGTTSPAFVARTGRPAYTVGARFSPVQGLLLRASMATGFLPPAPDQIGTFLGEGIGVVMADPKRGGIPGVGPVSVLSGGSPDLQVEEARSILLGFVILLGGDHGPRLSVDYTRIKKRHEIIPFPDRDASSLIADEALYPGRVIRGPLTAADAALGYTGGPITGLNLTAINLGRSRIDVFDVVLDYPFVLPSLGSFSAYLKATWEPHYRQQFLAGGPWIERIGYSDGPLAWRGNGGIDWSSGPWALGANGQFYGPYKVANAVNDLLGNAQRLRYQGATHIPAQFYLDVSGRYRVGEHDGFLPPNTEIRFGIVNLFDHSPPIIADPTLPGYSYYGDPRRRRIEVTMSVPIGRD